MLDHSTGAVNSAIPTDRGMMIIVVGASGVGKDSLLKDAQDRLQNEPLVHFAQRIITRETDEALEAHASVDEATFLSMRAAGQFVINWEAHGLHYGIPVKVCELLADNQLVVMNGSRAALPRCAELFPRRRVVHVVAQADIIKERLVARGRETADGISARSSRQINKEVFDATVWELDNSGPFAESSKRFTDFLRHYCQVLSALPG